MLLALILTMSIFTSCQQPESTAATTYTANKEQTFLNVAYGKDSMQKMDVYLPAKRSTNTKVLVLIHGGGWAFGDKSEFAASIPQLQQRLPDYAIFNINYRLATSSTNHFPTQENDLQAALKYVISKAKEYHISKDVVLLGASAGAHLALLQAYKHNEPVVPKAVISFFGPVDMADIYNSQANGYYKMGLQLLLGGTPTTKPKLFEQASPINFVNGQSPPTLLLHGGRDGVVPVSHSKRLKERLDTLGVASELVIYQNEGHGWQGSNMTKAYNEIETFLKAHVP